jgi:hypothetical protein
MANTKLEQYFRDLEDALLAQARASGILKSSTAKGNAREQFVNRLFEDQLPRRLGVEQGEVIDSHERSSGQVDCILVDSQSNAYRLGGQSLAPVESVIAVVEVKSTLAGKELERAVRKIASVKALARSEHHGFYVTSSDNQSRVPVPPVTPAGYIVGYTGPDRMKIGETLTKHTEWFNEDWFRFGPEVICVLGEGCVVKADQHLLLTDDRQMTCVASARPGTELISAQIRELVHRYGHLTYSVLGYHLDDRPT